MSRAFDIARLNRTGAPTFATAQDVRDMTVYRGSPPAYIRTAGALAAGDLGGGDWRWDAASVANDTTGTVLQLTGWVGAGRYQRLIDDEIHFAWFGLVGDGVTSNTIALRNALALGEGRTLLGPEGTYAFDGFLEIPDKCVIRGSGKRGFVLLAVEAFTAYSVFGNNAAITTTNNSVSFNNPQSFALENLTLRTNGASPTTSIAGVLITNVDGVGIKDCSFEVVEDTGYNVTNFRTLCAWRNIHIEGSDFFNRNRGSIGGGVWASNVNQYSTSDAEVCENISVRGCRFLKNQSDEAVAIFCRQGLIRNPVIDGNIFEFTGDVEIPVGVAFNASIDVDPPVWQPSTSYSVGDKVRPVVPNGRIYICTGAGVSGTESPTSRVPYESIADGTAQWICYFCGVQGATFSNNVLKSDNITLYAVRVGRDTTVSGTATEDFAGVENALIDGNTFVLKAELAQPYAISISSAPNVTVKNNTFTGVAGAAGNPRPFILGRTQTGENVIVTNNYFEGRVNATCVRYADLVENNTFDLDITDRIPIVEYVDICRLNKIRMRKIPVLNPYAIFNIAGKASDNLIYDETLGEWVPQSVLFAQNNVAAIARSLNQNYNLIAHGRQILESAPSNGHWSGAVQLTITGGQYGYMERSESTRYTRSGAYATCVYSDTSVDVSNRSVTLWFYGYSADGNEHNVLIYLGSGEDKSTTITCTLGPEQRGYGVRHTFGASAHLGFTVGFGAYSDVILSPFTAAFDSDIGGILPTDLGSDGAGICSRAFNGGLIFAAAPTWGSWQVGDVCYNAFCTPGGTRGWIYVSSGVWEAL